MTVKEELHAIVEGLGDPQAAEALEYVRWLQAEGETLSEEDLEAVERGEREIARGEYISLADLARSLDA
jgi:hypothetical protein